MPWLGRLKGRGAKLCLVLGMVSWLAGCFGDDDADDVPPCADCHEPDASDDADLGAGDGDGDGDGDTDGGDGGEHDGSIDADVPLADAGELADASGDADADAAAEAIVGLAFQQLWPKTQDGQASPHQELTGILTLPQDRGFLIWEKAGRISHYQLDGGELILQGELRLEDVLSYSDCGMTYVALDPEWETNHYLFATHCIERNHSVLVRYEFDGEHYDISDSRALVFEIHAEGVDSPWHNMTAIGFFDDAEHSMWVLAGEKQQDAKAQDTTTPLGKIMRIVPRRGEGTAGYDPHPDNPFAGDPSTSSGPDLYAWGLRSPWRGAMDSSGRLFIGDVGSDIEEVNLATEPGQNFGWSLAEGPCKPEQTDCTSMTDPVVYWSRGSNHRYRRDDEAAAPSNKRCAWVGTVYEPNENDRYEGFLDDTILFSDICLGYVRALSVDHGGEVLRDQHVGNLVGLTGAAIGSDGYLYVTSFGSCSAASNLGGGIYRVLPRMADDPGVIDPPAPTAALVDDPLGPFPAQISQTGIFADSALSEPIARAVRFEPTLPLWSSGSHKDRWLLLPEGGEVDNSDRAAWDFPVGTLFWKTFSYPGASPERIETRVIRRTESGYDYNVYAWNDDGRDAVLLTLEQSQRRGTTLEDGTVSRHTIPSRFDCRSCHESQDTSIIGFDELRLNGPREGQTESQLDALAALGIFEEALPSDPDRVVHADALTADVLGYLHGNCAHCHNGSPRTMSALVLEYGVAQANIVGVETMASGQAQGIRVVPQSPETSVLFQAFSGETTDIEVQPMPPLGVDRIDSSAVELLRTWIAALPVQ
jgi:glucose/arabinose dehydrogenase